MDDKNTQFTYWASGDGFCAAGATMKAHEILEWGLEGSGSLEGLEIPNLNILNLPNLLNLSQTFYIVS